MKHNTLHTISLAVFTPVSIYLISGNVLAVDTGGVSDKTGPTR